LEEPPPKKEDTSSGGWGASSMGGEGNRSLFLKARGRLYDDRALELGSSTQWEGRVLVGWKRPKRAPTSGEKSFLGNRMTFLRKGVRALVLLWRFTPAILRRKTISGLKRKKGRTEEGRGMVADPRPIEKA